jgi:hypothetical protein
MESILSALAFMGILGGCLIGMLLFGLLVNVLLFPEMWRQPDVPKIIRWLAAEDHR